MIDLPSELELAARIGLALLLGGVVGFEREINDQPAGLRTHIAVSLGACLFAIVSAYGFDEFNGPRADSVYQVDVTRVASQIVSGMGFLGGGAILKYGANVRGLTTAASLWVTAAIGLAVAVGSYTVALVTTAAVILSLVLLRMPKRWIEARIAAKESDVVVIRVADGAPAAPVIAAATSLEGIAVKSLNIERTETGVVVSLRAGAEKGRLEDVVAPLADRQDVATLEVD
ncbi:MAG TPA: MgtC/SapB family protein [Acidimicrobiales bacterium]|nr:MgtC/SapB family protein [Acidimicrobiales bacterium]